MADEEVAFGLDLEGNMAVVAKKMREEMARLEAQIKAVGKATTKNKRQFAQAKWFNGDDMQRHISWLERSQKSYRSLAPASAAFVKTLRSYGVSGGYIKKFAVDTAKAEVALRRLYRLKGGGKEGAAAVVGSLARRGVGKYGGSVVSGLGRAASGLGSAALGTAKFAGGAALAVGGAAAAGAGLLGYNLLEAGIQAEQVRFALDRVTNGKGLEWWKKASGYAKEFGMNVTTVAENLMDMKASGFDDSTVNTLFLRMGDLRAMGATEETIGRAMLAIRQVAAAGKLQGDELNQLSEAGINANIVFDVLGKKLGKTRAEILKMKESGKLSSDVVIPAIGEAIGVKTGGGAAGEAGRSAANSTLSGLWGKLKGSWSVVAADSMQNGPMEPLKVAINNFNDWLSGPGGTKTVDGFATFLGKIFSKAPAIIDGFIWLLDKGIPAACDGFMAGLEGTGVGEALRSLVGYFSDLSGENGIKAADTLRNFGEQIGEITGTVVTLVGWLGNAALALQNLGNVFKWMKWASYLTMPGVPLLFDGIGLVNDMISTNSGEDTSGSGAGATGAFGSANDNASLYGVGQNMAQGMADGLYAGTPAVRAAGAALAQSAEDAAREQSDTHSPSRAWERLANDETAGYIGGHKDGIPKIQSTAASITSASLSSASNDSANQNSGGAPSVQVNIAIDRGEGEGKSDKELMELAADIFERRMARIFGRLSYASVG